MSFFQKLELVAVILGIDLSNIGQIGVPTLPFKADGKWYTLTQVDAPVS